ncbi:type IV pilus secretin PilQ family protein [Ferrimonas sediminicola]|uniref:Type IV pilus secretin PilQ family protein n=1 Tax=Ferrimonas sediminicola TaxID=2569538 RepID=A0A4U1BBP3_9GAMM|nr:type IV pilus secretin PilQ family protein [Ferrimonas sediminicola]TKB48020.1 type IV pilus secretin PilQ family protein [Ferrimonas sediminicola]
MTRRVCWLLLMLLGLPLGAAELREVRLLDLPGSRLSLQLVFDQPGPEPQLVLSEEGATLSLWFAHGRTALPAERVPVSTPEVRSLSARNEGEGVMVTLELARSGPYRGRWQDNLYLLTFADRSGVAAALKQETEHALPEVRVESIRFRPRGRGGELVLSLDRPPGNARITQQPGRLSLVLPHTHLPREAQRVMDLSELGTLVRSFESFSEPLQTRVVLQLDGELRSSQQRRGNQLVLTLTPMVAHGAQPGYQGNRISLNFQDVPVRSVLQILAEHKQLNLVTSDSVDGNLTLRLDAVPWDQALALVLKVRGLASRREGNVLLVAPREELAAQKQAELQLQRESQQLAPLVSRHYQINYAKADDIATLLRGASGSNRLLSERGSATVDERTNILLLQDSAQRLAEVEALIRVLDVPVRQVVIESRMVNVRDNVDSELGIRWGLASGQSDGSVSGSIEGNDSIRQGVVPDIGDRLNINLPAVSSNASSFAFQVANLGDEFILDLELSALEAEDKGEIIASPRLTTSNQYTASIEQGEEIPYEESTSSGATSIAFKKAVLSLTVTPRITSDDKVVLDLLVTQDTRGRESASGEVGINTQRISTQVLARNGETVVLGGIFQQQELKTVSKVPLLGDLPYAGWLFRHTRNTAIKSELLIFVTPRIVVESF